MPRCPVLLITGSLSSQRRACRQLFEDLQKAQKHAEGRLTTREFFVIDGVANVIAERPDKVITSMQFFLQGIGLRELFILTLRGALCHSAISLLIGNAFANSDLKINVDLKSKIIIHRLHTHTKAYNLNEPRNTTQYHRNDTGI
ncbi:Ndr family protein [Clonorchis sinensis]|uniref:Ndr family protein n=1 Tax=Clonorchis sinensis TaxID=79923 RepID=G7YXM9_CLOSI|nr:Ndr family protein [Clonorchis sinensis]